MPSISPTISEAMFEFPGFVETPRTHADFGLKNLSRLLVFGTGIAEALRGSNSAYPSRARKLPSFENTKGFISIVLIFHFLLLSLIVE